MQAVGRRCCRPHSFTFRGYRDPYPSTSARSFRTSTINGHERTETSDDALAVSDDAYLDVQINQKNKTVTTAVGELPISPLMDPSFHEARQKFTKPKPSRSEYKMTKFQRHLARNPYALALAAPVRRCPITSASLPSFFFQRFNLLSHPETGKPWFAPSGLNTKAPNTATAAKDAVSEGGQTEPEPDNPAQVSLEDVQAGEETGESAAGAQKTGPSAYILSRQRLFQELQQPGSVYFNDHRRLLRMSDHGQTKLLAVLNTAHWRRDMDSVLLELLRRRAVEGLRHFADMTEKQDREYIVKCELWNDVKSLKHRGCLLYLGLPEGASSESGPRYIPPRLSTMDVGPSRFGSKLAVHNLYELLGEGHIRQLRQESELLRDGSLYLLGRRATVNLQMLLWKLQGYMAWEER